MHAPKPLLSLLSDPSWWGMFQSVDMCYDDPHLTPLHPSLLNPMHAFLALSPGPRMHLFAHPNACPAYPLHPSLLNPMHTFSALLSGPRLRYGAARDAFLKLAEASGFAVAILPDAKGMVPEDHPNFMGLYWGAVSWPGVCEVRIVVFNANISVQTSLT